MTPKDPFLEGTFWDKFWRPIRSRALLFTPESQTPEIARFPRQDKAMSHCDLRVRWKVASDLRFRAAISEPKTPSFCGISGDLAQSTRKALAIAIVRFGCARLNNPFPREASTLIFTEGGVPESDLALEESPSLQKGGFQSPILRWKNGP